MAGWMDERMVDGWMDGWMECMDAHGWMDGWMDGCIDGRTSTGTRQYVYWTGSSCTRTIVLERALYDVMPRGPGQV